MANETTPYIERNPGDLWTAEDWNGVQEMIKKDIAGQVGGVQTALDEHIQPPHDADTLDGKTPEQWRNELDQRYAHLDHEHDGVRRYRRYFLELEWIGTILPPAVIIHNMGRNPVIQVYELQDLPIAADPPLSRQFKFCFCGPEHHDEEAIPFKTKSWDERHWGDPIDKMIDELGRGLEDEQREEFDAQFKDDFTLDVWLRNIERRLFEPGPAQYHFDVDDVYRTQWVKDNSGTPVGTLKDQGQWPPRFVYRPRLVNATIFRPDGLTRVEFVDCFHLNVNEVEIAPHPRSEQPEGEPTPLCVMVLLRS